MKLPHPALLLVTDRTQARAPLADVLEQAFAGGCRWASLREKDLLAQEQIDLAQALLPVARRYGARLTLHGDAALAKAAGVDGVHLPAGADAPAARALLGAGALVGISVHERAEAESLDPAMLDYAVAGPAELTASKPGYGPALGPQGLAGLAAASRVPLVAIGGITAGNLEALLASGIAGIAVMGGLMRATDAAAEARALLAMLRRRT